MKYIIIGNSAAAIGAVEGIRQVDSDGEIKIISSDLIIPIQDLSYHIYYMEKPMSKE